MVGAGFPSYEGLPAGVSTETDAAWSVGAFANWSTSGVISVAIQPELLYVHESGVASSPTTSTTSSTSSLRAPILFKLQLFDRNIVQPSLYGGPSLSYILSAKQKTGDVESDIQDIHKFQFGFAIGVDVTILRFIVVDLRYNTKFSEITSDVSSDLKGVSFSLNSFRAGLGVRF
jgi:opacity protein-like surface antigen